MTDKEKDLTEEELAQATGGIRMRRTSENLQEADLSTSEPSEPEPTNKPKPKITGVGGLGDPTYQ